MDSDFLLNLKSKDDARELTSSLDILINAGYRSDIDIYALLKKVIRNDIADDLVDGIKQNQENWADYLQSVKQKVANLPIIEITLPIRPSSETLDVISDWVRVNLNSQLLVDIFYDPSIVAGAKVSYLGKYFELTAVGLLNERLRLNK